MGEVGAVGNGRREVEELVFDPPECEYIVEREEGVVWGGFLEEQSLDSTLLKGHYQCHTWCTNLSDPL